MFYLFIYLFACLLFICLFISFCRYKISELISVIKFIFCVYFTAFCDAIFYFVLLSTIYVFCSSVLSAGRFFPSLAQNIFANLHLEDVCVTSDPAHVKVRRC
jgi:hypothetical protein